MLPHGTRGTAVAVASAVLVLLPVLAGCVGSDSGPTSAERVDDAEIDDLPDPVTILQDPEGDATEKNSDWVRETTPCAAAEDAPEGTPGSCAVTDQVLFHEEPIGAVPADPARDLLDVRFQETPETLEISLDVAELPESLDGAIQEDETGDELHGSFYDVFWTDPVSGCIHIAGFGLSPAADAVDFDPYFVVYCAPVMDDGPVEGVCQAPSCLWGVPFEIEHGEPATLRWSVPREVLVSGHAGGQIPEAQALAVHLQPADGATSDEFQVEGPLTTGPSGFKDGDHVVDSAVSGANFTFTTPRVNGSHPTGPLTVGDQDVRVRDPPERPDLHIEEVTMDPTPDAFRFHVTLDEVAEEPLNHTLAVSFGTPGHLFSIGYVARDGERQTFANRFTGGFDPVSVPATVSARPGTPGQVTVELARSEIPDLSDGALLQALWATTFSYASEEVAVGGTVASRNRFRHGDYSSSAELHRLPAAPGSPAEDRATRVGDAPEDVETPADFTGTEERYDLLGAEVVSPTPDAMRFSLEIKDLSDLSPPTGYDAVFYAVGVEHPNGQTMLGHYRSQDRPGGEFLCAPDTTVMADSPADPTHTAWTRVDGTVLTSSSGQSGQGSPGAQTTANEASGAIVVTAPPSCFGLEAGADELNVTALQAGAYLVQRPLSETGQTDVHQLDHLESEDGFAAAFAEPPTTPAPSFWAQPFGIPNFWDILGAALAILTVLLTAALWLRRRRTFKNYLAEVQRIQEAYRHDAKARAAALVELRRDLYEDLQRHRISDSHYPIVLDRLRARLTSARLTSLGEGFYDIPTRISLRIERLLDDGYLSEEEAAVLEPVIGKSSMDDDQADDLVDRLDRWVEEDRREVSG